MPSAPLADLPAARSWAVAGSVAAGVSLPQKAEAVVEGLELFAAAPAEAEAEAEAEADDGYARWKAEVAAERAEQEAAPQHLRLCLEDHEFPATAIESVVRSAP